MANGGEQVSRALALMDQFYVSMMDSGVLKIIAFQYECFSEITEDTYFKFLTNFSNLASAIKVLHEEIFSPERVDVACQTMKVSLPGNLPSILPKEEKQLVRAPTVQKVNLPLIPQPPKVTGKGREPVKRAPMLCDYCDQKFTTIENFEIHIRNVHGEQFTRSFFSCEICNQQFLSSETLYEHISCAHQLTEEDELDSDQLCAYCAEIISSWQELVDHCIEKHDAYMCRTCHIMCDTQEALEKHINESHMTGVIPEEIPEIPVAPTPVKSSRPVGRPPNPNPPKPRPVDPNSPPKKRGRPRKLKPKEYVATLLECSICMLQFPTEGSLKFHVNNHHEPSEQELTCKKCNLKFRRRTALINHLRLVHDKYYNRYGVEEEGEIILGGPAKTKFIKPQTPVISEQKRPPAPEETPSQTKNESPMLKRGRLHCEVCAPSMTQHELRTHIASDHRYRCPFCALTFWWKTNLESHLKQLHNSKDTCPTCLTVATEEKLRQHILQQHTPRKLYVCKVCDAEHFTVKDLNEHDIVHANNNKQKFKCDLCHRSFYTRDRLRGHLLRHLHGSFCCYLCGQQCQTQDELQKHLLRHRKSQFACFCGQRFVKKTELQAHQRSNVCKQGVASGPKADIFVEVCVPDDEEEVEMIPSSFNKTKMERLEEGEECNSNVWQINIAVPAEAPEHMSRDFLTALAHSVNSSENPEAELLASGNQPILILDSTSDTSEATIVREHQAQVVKWMQNHGLEVIATEQIDEEEQDIKMVITGDIADE
ncbi:hypothetical protein B566_EDAN014487 [Ephemera danica]|nr:hypothetical protein B566_EDAN014487 [Ephemera danica]